MNLAPGGPDQLANTTVIEKAAAAAIAADRLKVSARVGAIISRRAVAAGLSDGDYFREIIAGRAPRITKVDVVREPPPP
jgi:hypothetical protein